MSLHTSVNSRKNNLVYSYASCWLLECLTAPLHPFLLPLSYLRHWVPLLPPLLSDYMGIRTMFRSTGLYSYNSPLCVSMLPKYELFGRFAYILQDQSLFGEMHYKISLKDLFTCGWIQIECFTLGLVVWWLISVTFLEINFKIKMIMSEQLQLCRSNHVMMLFGILNHWWFTHHEIQMYCTVPPLDVIIQTQQPLLKA